jgi:hypothetical protein
MISIPVSDRIVQWFEVVDGNIVGEIVVYKPGEWIYDLKRLIASCASGSQS